MKEEAQGTTNQLQQGDSDDTRILCLIIWQPYSTTTQDPGPSFFGMTYGDSRGTRLPGTTALLPDTTNKSRATQGSKPRSCRYGPNVLSVRL